MLSQCEKMLRSLIFSKCERIRSRVLYQLIRHDKGKDKIEQNHGTHRREYQNEKNDTHNRGIPPQIVGNSAAHTCDHFVCT
jgi:hypothetical protein